MRKTMGVKFYDIIDNTPEGRIRPCPFCGETPKVKEVKILNKKTFELKCRNIYCPSNITWAKSENEIISIWNRRVNG